MNEDICPKCQNVMDKYEGVEYHKFPTRYKALWLCDICGHMIMVNHDGTREEYIRRR